MMAEWRQIMLDKAVTRKALDLFTIKHVGDYNFKGFSTRQPVGELSGYFARVRPNMYYGDLVGRDQEMSQLLSFIGPIFEPTPQNGSDRPVESESKVRFAGMLAICGEAGIGKSRLIYESRKSINPTANIYWVD